ncbi:AMMECR1 domain-containing protein [uncultured Lamprocystis sp.]|uniref:AMMECR1 domain-containing protein n=1 Tax=uncultured Lamprocystis sp. TaxID=543132 RepID=UPI0025DAE83E|nr:AMMECR1 domain-containing protein [uncultured Lamprocystis sp.]
MWSSPNTSPALRVFIERTADGERHRSLRAPAGAFVTLLRRGALRGCIGTIEPRAALCGRAR